MPVPLSGKTKSDPLDSEFDPLLPGFEADGRLAAFQLTGDFADALFAGKLSQSFQFIGGPKNTFTACGTRHR